jgi:hypothetical protein
MLDAQQLSPVAGAGQQGASDTSDSGNDPG